MLLGSERLSSQHQWGQGVPGSRGKGGPRSSRGGCRLGRRGGRRWVSQQPGWGQRTQRASGVGKGVGKGWGGGRPSCLPRSVTDPQGRPAAAYLHSSLFLHRGKPKHRAPPGAPSP